MAPHAKRQGVDLGQLQLLVAAISTCRSTPYPSSVPTAVPNSVDLAAAVSTCGSTGVLSRLQHLPQLLGLTIHLAAAPITIALIRAVARHSILHLASDVVDACFHP